MTNNFNAAVKPLIEKGGKYDGKVKAIIRLQVQPWHSSSTLVHEIALAVSSNSLPSGRTGQDLMGVNVSQVARVSPEKFWEFHRALMDGQEDFYDIPSSKRTPTETRVKLVELALPIVGEDKRDILADLISHKSTPNGGNAVTDELKYTSMFTPGVFVTEA
jgi:hypothetical protein